MSDALFPDLPGLTWEIKAVPTFSVDKQKSKNNAVTALINDPFPQWSFELNYEFLRGVTPAKSTAANPRNYSELNQIVGFFLQRTGSADTFLLDPGMLTRKSGEWQVHGAVLGIGDGITTTFYLQRDCGGFMDEVQDPVGTPSISVNGTAATGWTLGTHGDINFTTPPATGGLITADFRWRWRVRFAEDSLNVEAFMYQLYELQSVKLEQDRR